ncbi:9978_t:CDS:2 [Acaulospora morrowiae]|uniref:9978_t:CDS:1 n=1 Tax=Acaulospora morrowiae TaxID=94023 RepID=A0A9N8VF72_9GLOM|nr:9978_t:CDS:2 [Acaulospora morrowiae]
MGLCRNVNAIGKIVRMKDVTFLDNSVIIKVVQVRRVRVMRKQKQSFPCDVLCDSRSDGSRSCVQVYSVVINEERITSGGDIRGFPSLVEG